VGHASGHRARRGAGGGARLLLLTDADIGYRPRALQALVQRAEAGGLVMVSLMAKLRCRSRPNAR